MEKNRFSPVKAGKGIRMSYSRQKDVLAIPNLIEVQKDSYEWFVKKGLKEVLDDISPIEDYGKNLSLEFLEPSLDEEGIKYSIQECKDRDATYSAPLKVKVRLHNKETGEFTEHVIFMGDLPLMTDTGTFVINGAERVIVSQLVRSPGIYPAMDKDKIGKELFTAQVIPNRGAWLEYETDSNDIFYVRVDRTRKVPVTVLIRALGVGTDEEIAELFGEETKITATLEKDPSKNYEEGLLELYKKLRPGEPLNVETAQNLIEGMFFEPRRYDLARVGRYKFNEKLAYKGRIVGHTIAEDVIDENTGEVLAKAGKVATKEMAEAIQNAAVRKVVIQTPTKNEVVFSNMMVDIEHYVKFNKNETPEDFGVNEWVYYPKLMELMSEYRKGPDLKEAIRANISELIPKHITKEDILASINYTMNVEYGIGKVEDIDHLGNRRIRAVGELLQNQYRIGLSRMERVVRERMTTQDLEGVSPQTLINIKPVTAAVKEFFGSSQLSQFMDQNNPLGELTHKRRLSALGPGGLSRDRASFEVRDVHYTHYGRMCPIETPEGPNIGLINSFATYARLNEYGFIEAPYRIVDKKNPENPRVTDEVVYLTADKEDEYHVAQANAELDEKGHFVRHHISGRYQEEQNTFRRSEIDLMDVSPKMVFSVATSMIPFLQNDDANRALMGSNMQRQAVPLMTTESPIVGTGMEAKTAEDSGVCVLAEHPGKVIDSTSEKIVIKNDDNKEEQTYMLSKFARSNQSNCYNQRPIVDVDDHVEAGEVIADGASTSNGEMALGKNPLIGFMTWEGYNYEDAVLISERLVQDDVYTSIHIEEYETEARDTKLGPEDISNDIPGVGDEARKNLDEDGIIHIGAEVRAGDILVGKVTPKGETELTPEDRLLRAIFAEKAREVRDTSLKVPHGESGVVVDVKVFKRENGDELAPGVNESVRVYVAQKRKISVGDKMAGRHGNKGVVSRVLPVEDMPFLPNGRPLDIVLNPLGVPSRMNIGQVLEIHLSLAAQVLGFKVSTPVFDGAKENDIKDTLILANDYANMEWKDFKKKYDKILNKDVMKYLGDHLDNRDKWKGVHIQEDGKVQLRDGRTGEEFDNKVTIGFMHYLKLHHLVDDKIHARSTGPYSLVTQQPLGGKAQFGGQRFGEMEVWALEAYGASYTLQEILTVKSDDINGRVKTYEAIIKGKNIPQPGIPESFKVLIKELQSLALDIKVLDEDDKEVEIKESTEYENVSFNSILNERNYGRKEGASEMEQAGFTTQEVKSDGIKDVEADAEDAQ
ncbi:MAG: DNA-directed RNA polymerase subunit beta [Eubacterium sp.]|nr:DNA-directed RNA polymerase subunit beta [Eubacterium sp.]